VSDCIIGLRIEIPLIESNNPSTNFP